VEPSSGVVIGELIGAIVEIVWAYVLPWRVVCSAGVSVLLAAALWWLTDHSIRIDIFLGALILGFVAGIAWELRHR
jgi:hypothetical protein